MLDWLREQEAGFSAVAAILVIGAGEKPDICTLRLPTNDTVSALKHIANPILTSDNDP
jgi:hypothetical protein